MLLLAFVLIMYKKNTFYITPICTISLCIYLVPKLLYLPFLFRYLLLLVYEAFYSVSDAYKDVANARERSRVPAPCSKPCSHNTDNIRL